MSTSLSLLIFVAAIAVMEALLRKTEPVFSLLLSIAAALLLVQKAGRAVQELMQGIALLARQTDGQAFSCLIRCTGILLLTDYVRSLCAEAGANSLGWCTGLVGRCLLLASAWPLIREISRAIWGLAG